MSYRDGYDIRRWSANEAKRRHRSASIRWSLLFGMALVLAMPVVALIGGPDDRAVVSVLPYLPLMLAVGQSPFGRDSWLGPGWKSFDEFEREMLDRAARRAYSLFLALTLVGAMWLWAATRWGLPVPETSQDWSAWVFTLLLAGLALPTVVAEWMVPLPPALDEIDD